MTAFQYERRGRNQDILTVEVSGWLDAQRCDYFFGCLEHLIDDGSTKLVVDCSALSEISSVGLGMLVRIHARMKRVGGAVHLACVTGATAKVLALVHLDRVFQIDETVADAVAALGG